MRKHRHLPLAAAFCLLLSGFSLTRAQQQAGKTQSISQCFITGAGSSAPRPERARGSRSAYRCSGERAEPIFTERPCNCQAFSDARSPLRDGLLVLELGFHSLELVCKRLVFTLGEQNVRIAHVLPSEQLSVGLWALKTGRRHDFPWRQNPVPDTETCHLASSHLSEISFPSLF